MALDRHILMQNCVHIHRHASSQAVGSEMTSDRLTRDMRDNMKCKGVCVKQTQMLLQCARLDLNFCRRSKCKSPLDRTARLPPPNWHRHSPCLNILPLPPPKWPETFLTALTELNNILQQCYKKKCTTTKKCTSRR